MYICVCKGITDKQVREVAKYSHSAKEVAKKLGLGTDCGTCVQSAIELVMEESKTAPKAAQKPE
jgi:bacterioferritin-associated ferredoxin